MDYQNEPNSNKADSGKRYNLYLIVFLLFISLASFMMLRSEADTAVTYVTVNGAGNGSGSDWANAMSGDNFANALRDRNDGSSEATYWLASGDYKPTTDGDRGKSFTITNKLKIYGGFAGTEPASFNIASRDLKTNVTRFTGNISDDATSADNSHHVVYAYSVGKDGNSALLDGVTISDGNAVDASHAYGGGGIFTLLCGASFDIVNCTITDNFAPTGGGIGNYNSSSPTIKNCTIKNNSVSSSGGGISNTDNSSPTIISCDISGNSAVGQNASGGGIYNTALLTLTDCTIKGNSSIGGDSTSGYGGGISTSSAAVITNCTIADNSATYGGGGISTSGSLTMENCIIINNSAVNGGGIRNSWGSATAITNCTISGNTATDNKSSGDGGALYSFNSKSAPVIRNCTISGNSAWSNGGGIYNGEAKSCIITNCTITDNTATGDSSEGGGVYHYYNCAAVITNCTITGNSVKKGGGGVYDYNVPSRITNSIIWGNTAVNNSSGAELYSYKAQTKTLVTYSAVKGDTVYEGEGNTNQDPKLLVSGDNGGPAATYAISAAGSSFRAGLTPGTQIKSGDTVLAEVPSLDARGVTRIEGVSADMGAYAYIVESAEISGDILSKTEYAIGASEDLKGVSIKLTGTEARDTYPGSVIWEVTGDAVSVDQNGRMTVQKLGSSTITAIKTKGTKADNSAVTFTDKTAAVSVYNAPEDAKIELTPKIKLIYPGGNAVYTISMDAAYSSYLEPISVDWAISDTANFQITSKDSSGVTVESKERTSGKCTVTMTVTGQKSNKAVTKTAELTSARTEPAAEVTEATKTDRDSSGVIVISKDTTEDLAIYDALAKLSETGKLPDGISASAYAIQAKSKDIEITSYDIFTKEKVTAAVAQYWNLGESSKEKVRIVEVQNTSGAEKESLFAKVWRLLKSFFTGETYNGADYLPLQTNFTITSSDIEALPSEIKEGLGAGNLLERIGLFAVVKSGDESVAARSLNDAASGDAAKFIEVTGSSETGYTVKTKALLFDHEGGVKEGMGAKWVQKLFVKSTDRTTEREKDNYFIVQDGKADRNYELCMAFAVRETNYAAINVTVSSDAPAVDMTWNIRGEATGLSADITGNAASNDISQDKYTIVFPKYEGYELNVPYTQSRDLKWGGTWNISADYKLIAVTSDSVKITASPDISEIQITKPDDVKIVALSYEGTGGAAVSPKWSADTEKYLSMDKTSAVSKDTEITAKLLQGTGQGRTKITLELTLLDGSKVSKDREITVTNAFKIAKGEEITISRDMTIRSIKIEDGGKLIITDLGALTVETSMDAAEGSAIELDGKGSLTVKGHAAGRPAVTVTNSHTINIKTGAGSTITYPEASVSGDKYPAGLVIAETKKVVNSQDITAYSLDAHVSGDETDGYKPSITAASFDEQLKVKSSDIKGLYVVQAKSTEQDAGKLFLVRFSVTSKDLPASADKTGFLRLAKLTADGTYRELARVRGMNLLSDGKWLIKSGGRALSASDALSGDMEINVAVKDGGTYDKNAASGDIADPVVLFFDGTYIDDPKPETPSSGGSGGCNAGFAALAFLAVIPVIAGKRKSRK